MLGAQDPRLARRVGAIAIAALVAACAALMFLFDRASLGSAVRFRVLFHHSAGLREHAPLVVGGQAIGRIEAISPVPHGAPGPLGGEVGVAVSVAVASDQAWSVPAGATIFVASRGPLSDRYLEVAPDGGAPGPAIHEGAELRGVDPPTLDNVLQHTWTNLMVFRLFVETVRPELTRLEVAIERLRTEWTAVAGDAVGEPDALSALAAAARGLAASANRTYDPALGGASGVARIGAAIADARRMIAALQGTIDALGPQLASVGGQIARIRGHVAAADPVARTEQLIATLRGVLDRVDPLLATAAQLAERYAAGEGTVGRILHDPEFPEDTKELGKYIKRHPWKILDRPPN